MPSTIYALKNCLLFCNFRFLKEKKNDKHLEKEASLELEQPSIHVCTPNEI